MHSLSPLLGTGCSPPPCGTLAVGYTLCVPSQPSTADIRAWAISEGIDVGDRGRIAADVRRAYAQAHAPRQRPAPKTAHVEQPTEPAANQVAPLDGRLTAAERRIAALEEQVQVLAAQRSRLRFRRSS